MTDYPDYAREHYEDEDQPVDLDDFELEEPTPEEIFASVDWSSDDPESWTEMNR